MLQPKDASPSVLQYPASTASSQALALCASLVAQSSQISRSTRLVFAYRIVHRLSSPTQSPKTVPSIASSATATTLTMSAEPAVPLAQLSILFTPTRMIARKNVFGLVLSIPLYMVIMQQINVFENVPI